MRLPLLVAARPKFTAGGPTVLLSDGCWAIVIDHVRGEHSSLAIHINGNGPTPLPCKHITGPCTVSVQITSPGSEDYINVFAELQ